MSMIYTTQYRHDTQLKNENQPWKHAKQASYCYNQQNPFNQTQQNDPNPYSNIIYTKSQQQLKNPRNHGNKHEILRENKKTHTFSWRLMLRWWRTMEV